MHDLRLQLVHEVFTKKTTPLTLDSTCALLSALDLPTKITCPKDYPRDDRVILVSSQVHINLHELPMYAQYSCEVVRLTYGEELFHYGEVLTLDRLLHDIRLACCDARRRKPIARH